MHAFLRLCFVRPKKFPFPIFRKRLYKKGSFRFCRRSLSCIFISRATHPNAPAGAFHIAKQYFTPHSGISLTARAEQLELSDFAKIADNL
jgi:hypothetical protein